MQELRQVVMLNGSCRKVYWGQTQVEFAVYIREAGIRAEFTVGERDGNRSSSK